MFHKAVELELKEGTTVELTFQSGEVKRYDMSILFEKYPQLEALKNRELFLSGKLLGAYGVVWNDELDIEAETIYEDGITIRNKTMSINYIVGEAVSIARSRVGMSQKELSLKTGIDQSDISKIERGTANPSICTLDRLAKGMGMRLKIDIIQ